MLQKMFNFCYDDKMSGTLIEMTDVWPGAMWTVVPPCQPAELLVHALVAPFLPLNLSMWKTTSLITWMEKTSLTNVKVIFRYSREWSHFSKKN